MTRKFVDASVLIAASRPQITATCITHNRAQPKGQQERAFHPPQFDFEHRIANGHIRGFFRNLRNIGELFASYHRLLSIKIIGIGSGVIGSMKTTVQTLVTRLE